MKRIMAWILGLATTVVAFFILRKKGFEFMRKLWDDRVEEFIKLKGKKALDEYHALIESEAKKLAKANAEEVMKSWKERFGTK